MLRLKTNVMKSSIAGVGLFAAQDIKKGDIVWEYTPETCLTLTQEQMKVFSTSFHKNENQMIHYYLTYAYYQSLISSLVFCLDNGRFVNHSDQPNLGSPSHLNQESAWQYSVALRDIKEGEELTENYHTYDTVEWLEQLCQEYGIHHYPSTSHT